MGGALPCSSTPYREFPTWNPNTTLILGPRALPELRKPRNYVCKQRQFGRDAEIPGQCGYAARLPHCPGGKSVKQQAWSVLRSPRILEGPVDVPLLEQQPSYSDTGDPWTLFSFRSRNA